MALAIKDCMHVRNSYEHEIVRMLHELLQAMIVVDMEMIVHDSPFVPIEYMRA